MSLKGSINHARKVAKETKERLRPQVDAIRQQGHAIAERIRKDLGLSEKPPKK